MKTVKLDEASLERALGVRDLTDPASGPHAVQRLVGDVARALGGPLRELRGPRVVSVMDNYYDLGVPTEGVTLDARWVTSETILRTHMSALVPPALRMLAADSTWHDVLLLAPGLIYRRERIGRYHASEPHQLDVWRLKRGPFEPDSLRAMIETIMATVLPGHTWRVSESMAPYAFDVLQIDVEVDGSWVEVGECGHAHPERLLGRAGLPPDVTGLGMGLGLDRLLMLRKGMTDIRLLRVASPDIQAQMQNLAPFVPAPTMPALATELSTVTDEMVSTEELGDRVRTALGERVASIEELSAISETTWSQLDEESRARLGVREGRKHVLLKLVIRDLERTLSADELGNLRREVAAVLDEGAQAP